ncbi:MAG TPA: hypothetical protein VFE53_09245 [Mucilaginibacter sp.]|jgi:hypothetical protein|nr:hypothetical protein [Mucilaginibacter sp.]
MKVKKTISIAALLIFGFILAASGQRVTHYNLLELLKEKKLDTTAKDQEIQVFFNPKNQAITLKGILWLKNTTFKEGTIDVELRGRGTLARSFMGIAFHGKDTMAYDVVYFCPFRFHDTSTVARKWSVKYMSLPDYDFLKLRKEHPGIYENEVNPAPGDGDWFHTTIVVKEGWITIYVNHSVTPSLKVKQLPTLTDGKIGLWSYPDTPGCDFADLTITQ